MEDNIPVALPESADGGGSKDLEAAPKLGSGVHSFAGGAGGGGGGV
jgi:hypothetical protein